MLFRSDEYAPTEQAVMLKATGGNYGGGTETLIAAPTQKVIAIQGNIIGRLPQNGPQGSGFSEDVCFTLTATDQHAVVIPYTLKIRSGCEGGVREL